MDAPRPASPEEGSDGRSMVERLGGEERLRQITDAFVDRVVKDVMIGFFFRSIDLDRLKQFEYEFASSHLGGCARYSGRPLARAHAAHPILGGQFNRRLKILENTLRDFGVAKDITNAWLAHNARLRAAITRDAGDQCNLPAEQPPDAEDGS